MLWSKKIYDFQSIAVATEINVMVSPILQSWPFSEPFMEPMSPDEMYCPDYHLPS